MLALSSPTRGVLCIWTLTLPLLLFVNAGQRSGGGGGDALRWLFLPCLPMAKVEVPILSRF